MQDQLRSWTRRSALAVAVSLVALTAAPSAFAKAAPHDAMVPFRSDADLIAYLKKMRRTPPPPPAPAPMAADSASAPAATSKAESRASTGSGEKITNTQEADVDEGGIVKMHGDTLVILRRGRLFTVSTRQGSLRPIDYIDAFPPGVDPRSDWYDEMLVSGNRVIVIGYSYGRGGTEINRFRIDRDGHLSFEDAYHLRSNDYYSSRNYASRLIGTKLIVYSPLYLPYGEVSNFEWMPGLRKWQGDERGGFQRIVSARQIYVPENWRNDEDQVDIDALHTVTSCDLAAPVLRCNATGVFGPSSRNFYVSSNAVYVWMNNNPYRRDEREGPASALVYRLPLDGSAPSAIGAYGAPTDQFSFREDGEDGVLNVLVHSEGQGDAMWMPEFVGGNLALARIPISDFGSGGDTVDRRRYHPLPRGDQSGNYYAFQNRFVGDYVLYGTGTSWGRSQGGGSTVTVAHIRGQGVVQLRVPHGIDRIEQMGSDAVVIGADQRDLHFRAVELTRGRPALGDDYTLEGASQGETRSQAFFFKPEAGDGWWGDAGNGVLGLPVARAGRPGYQQLAENSAAMIFLRRQDRRFVRLGEIGSSSSGVVDDACRASCVDWYGNARPIFLSKRTFALMGYEIVEGDLSARSVREIRRINFAPPSRRERPRQGW